MPRIELTLPGSIRSKKNSKRIFSVGRFKKVLPSSAYTAWEQRARESWYDAVRQGDAQFMRPLTCPVHVSAQIYYKGPRPDLSGCLESIGDCLEGILWADDTQIESWDGSRLWHDLKNPRTVISVYWGTEK
jgi:Holliday junction resolvase RusA-like endonuclease